jgi:hypothetical protein
MHDTDPCLGQNVGRRRTFWTTRVDVCGDYVLCGTVCTIPGLEYEDIEEPYVDPRIYPPVGSEVGYRTIKTDEWLQGLVLNILNTRARNDIRCPAPSAVFGHWSESYRDDGLYIGSTMWNAAEKSYIRTSDGVKAIGVAIRADMGKLIALGLADTVEVEATYVGSASVTVKITITKQASRSVINLSGRFVAETWVWH